MNEHVQSPSTTEALKKSLEEATAKVKDWPASKREGAEATVYIKSLASYYESAHPRRK